MLKKRSRIDKLIEHWDPVLRRAFEASVYELRGAAQVEQIARMIESGNIEGALRAVHLDPVSFREFDKSLVASFEAGGNLTAGAVPIVAHADGLRVRFQFNIRNPAAENWLFNHSSSMVTEILSDQRELVREHLRVNMLQGNNPRTAALDLVGRIGAAGRREGGVIGLTSSQSEWVRNYRGELLSDNPLRALERNLRDKRFDGAVRRAVAAGEKLSPAQVERMVTAYTNRALRFRAEGIARTEAMASLHESQQQAMEQAISSGAVKGDTVSFIWHATHDDRTRDSHADMDLQEVKIGEMFVTGDGNELEFPGDPNGVPEEIINCRCWREPNVDFLAGLT